MIGVDVFYNWFKIEDGVEFSSMESNRLTNMCIGKLRKIFKDE